MLPFLAIWTSSMSTAKDALNRPPVRTFVLFHIRYFPPFSGVGLLCGPFTRLQTLKTRPERVRIANSLVGLSPLFFPCHVPSPCVKQGPPTSSTALSR